MHLMSRPRRTMLAGVGVAAAAVTAVTAVTGAPAAVADDGWHAGTDRVYRVTILNLTDGQPFTPPVVATHQRRVDVFEVGSPADEGVVEIAENGDTSFLEEALAGNPRVADVHVGSAPVLSNVTADGVPAEFRNFTSFEITADARANRLSWVSMIICSNDGFTGVDSVRLPNRVGRSVVEYTEAYDAGSEVNSQRFGDIVPPCQGLVGVTGSPGTGASNPALAEDGVITKHPNVTEATEDGLQPEPHGWQGPVAQVVVTRVA
ncbi:MAG: spondin domain-containing protein [Kineosporiaceae bacterium]